jgi:hypothetical protein
MFTQCNRASDEMYVPKPVQEEVFANETQSSEEIPDEEPSQTEETPEMPIYELL